MHHIYIIPLIAGFITQVSKIFIKSNNLKWNWKGLIAYSGMPSGHAAITVSLATIVGFEEGWGSPLFAISLVLAFLIIRDALGLRKFLGQHGKALNDLVKDLGNDNVLDKNYSPQLERIGHTPMQIIIGGLIGCVISLIGFFFI